jgi:hypothetical protein
LLIDRLEQDPRYESVLKKPHNNKKEKADSRKFHQQKNKIIEDEIRDYIDSEYRMVI